jgi:plastocyanin
MKSLKFFKPALATTLGIDSWRLVLILATAISLIGYPKPASAATANVTVGVHVPLAGITFVPLSVTIHPGDQVNWTWATSGHSTTSGHPGMPNGILQSSWRGRHSNSDEYDINTNTHSHIHSYSHAERHTWRCYGYRS